MHFTFRNVSDALPCLAEMLFHNGVKTESRNGPVYQSHGPVLIQYTKPRERVLFYPERDANPFFHLMESLWMLAGRCDVAFVAEYVKRMKEFSSDGVTFHGAYGYRWRNHFQKDQLIIAAERLKKYPNDRRTVVAMWDADDDLQKGNESKDIPCNTHIYFAVKEGKLDMTVCNRSNDLIWGCCGANAVHMSYLQEYMAARVGVEMGSYYQFTNNLHMYETTKEKAVGLAADINPYGQFRFQSHPLVGNPAVFDNEVQEFCEGRRHKLTEWFFLHVANPMALAWDLYKSGDKQKALEVAKTVGSEDWRRAAVEWLERRSSNGSLSV